MHNEKIIKIAYWVTFIAILAIPFSALVVSDSLFFPFITGKAIVFRTFVEIAFFAWVLLALFDHKYRPRDSNILFVFSLFVIWMFVADLFAVNPHKAFFGNFERMEGWITLLHLFLFFIVSGSLLRTWKLWKVFWFISLGVSVIIAFDAFLDTAHALSGTRVGGVFGNPIYLAAYALFHIFIAVYYFFNRQILSRATRLFLCAAALLNLIILFYSGTRSAMLGLCAGVIISASLFFAVRHGIGKKAFVLIAIAVIIIALVFLLARLPILRKSFIFSRIASISFNEGKTRFTLWQMAFEGMKERPIFGWGQEGYNYVFATYYKPSLFNQEQWFDRAHNAYLDWLTAGGIPAFLLYIAIFRLVIQSILKNEKDVVSAALLIGAVAAYAVHSLFVFDNLMTSILFIAVFAYAHALSAAPPRLSGHGLLSRTFTLQSRYARFAIIGGVIVIFSVMQFFTILRPFMVNKALMKALHSNDARIAIKHFDEALSYGFFKQEIREQLTSFSLKVSAVSGIPDDIRVKVAQCAEKEMSEQILETPKDPRAYVMRSVVRRAAFDAQGALSDLEKAKKLSPRKQVLFIEQGNIAYAIGDKQMAANLFLQAYALDESFHEAAAYAGAGLIAIGKKQDGQAILHKHFNTAFPNHPFVKKVYSDI